MKKYVIYVYIVGQYFYVGLTNNIKRRDYEHRSLNNDSLYKFCERYNYEIPEYKILEEGLNMVEAQAKEGNWRDYYIAQGFLQINKATMGIYTSSLGHHNIIHSIATSSKSKNEIKYKDFLNKAQSCSTLNEFRKKYMKYYTYGRNHGWFEGVVWPEQYKASIDKIDYSSYNDSEISDICKKFKSRTELNLYNRRLYKYLSSKGELGKYFPKILKIGYKGKSYSDEECLLEMSKYTTKTAFAKGSPQIYNYCRHFGKLSYYDSFKNVRKKRGYISSYDLSDISLDDKYRCYYDGQNYLVNPSNCEVYLVIKNKAHLVSFYDIALGLRGFRSSGDNHVFVPYHLILQLSLGYGYCNLVKYKDGNFSNISRDNIEFDLLDMQQFVSIEKYPEKYINSKGEFYDSHYKMMLPLRTVNGRKVYRGCYIDKLVCKYFKGIKNDCFDVIHKDGDYLNDNADNLYIVSKLSPKKSSTIVSVKECGGYNEICIKDVLGQEYYVCNIVNKKTAGLIKSELIGLYNMNIHIEQWIEKYRKETLPKHIELDSILTNIKVKTESSGCYWDSQKKAWISSIYFDEKKYMLGEFDQFEIGKLLFEIASLMVKYGKFEQWYESSFRLDVQRLEKLF